jgi:hypothetical protein
MKSDDGYSSISVFILILFLSAISLSALHIIQISLLRSSKYNREYEIRQKLDEKAWALIEILGNDPTPEADSIFDPVWTYIESENEGDTQIGLEDISSKFNLNFMRTKMLDKSSLKNSMIEGHTPEELKQFRGENGFSSDLIETYGKFFPEENLKKYFTVYSYANFNVTYEDSLKKLYEIRVSEDSGHSFLNTVQQHVSGRVMADHQTYKNLVGTAYDNLYPVVNTQPLMNVNFVPGPVLESVLHYPYGGEKHEQSDSFFEVIMTERAILEFSDEKLKNLLDIEDDYLRIREYLGTRTWFWRISIIDDESSLEVIISVIPADETDKMEKKVRVIRWKYHNS